MRLMGKREIGKLSVFDLVVSIMIADFAVISVEDPSIPLIHGIVPMVTMLAAQVALAWVTMKNSRIRSVVEGRPSVLINNGKVQEKEMGKQRYNMEDLMVQLRENNIADVADVEFAILEPSGKLTVFPKEEKLPLTKGDFFGQVKRLSRLPVPVVIDSRVQEGALKDLGKSRGWLLDQLRQYGYMDIKDVFFASIDENGRFYIDERED